MTTAIPHTPLTVQRFADTAEPEPRHVFEMARKHGVRMVDFKFTDLPGTWQHVSLSIHGLEEEAFEEGLGFDGSSIRGFQEISESDMILIPDPSTAIIDPFHEQRTMSIICNIFDPITREPYSRDPRYVAQKAEGYLIETGIADTCFMGPEAEFFVFDHVAFDQTVNRAFYEVDSEQGFWNRGAGFGNGSMNGVRRQPRLHAAAPGGLLPGPAGRHPLRPARADGRRAGGDGDRLRVPPPRGLGGRPGGDRPAGSTSCCAWATSSRPTSTWSRTSPARPASRQPSCRSRCSRRTPPGCTSTSRCSWAATTSCTTSTATACCRARRSTTSAA